jgi:hypothetical protein
VALPAAGQATPERPTAAPYGRGARPPKAGRFVGLSGPQQPCPTPARPRAPLAAVGGKARANNRGLAKEIPDQDPKTDRTKDPSMCNPHQLNSNRSILVIRGIGPGVSTVGP